MTRHHRYVGENHFPPPENEDRPHGWHFIGGRECYGPLPAYARQSPSHVAKLAANRPDVAEKRRVGIAGAIASKRYGGGA